MEKYIALLRGINVGGHRLIKMEHLKDVFYAMKFKSVQTYIQSGNIIFETKATDAIVLQQKIEQQLYDVYGFEVTIFIRTIKEIELAIKNNPFKPSEIPATNQPYVTFLHTPPTAAQIELLLSYNSEVDIFRVAGSEVYSVTHKDKGKSVFSANFIENKLKKPATARNWLTVQKLLTF